MAPAFDADASKVHPIQHPTVDGPIPSNTDFTEFARARVPGLRHFQPAEFLIKGSTNALMHSNTDPPRDLWPNIIKIIQVMDEFRSRIGSPVVLNSVYRSEAYNRAVGGVSDSQHTKFRAADFRVIDGMSPSSWAGLLRQMREEGVFQGGIGVYSTFVHVDTRGLNANW